MVSYTIVIHIYIYRYVVVSYDKATIGRGDDTVGNPHRAQICQSELFELILFLKLDKQLPVEQFEAVASQSIVPFPPLSIAFLYYFCLS